MSLLNKKDINLKIIYAIGFEKAKKTFG